MASAVEGLLRVGTDGPDVGLMHQSGRLERLPRHLAGQPGRGQLALFVVHQGEELPGLLRVAPLDVREEPRLERQALEPT